MTALSHGSAPAEAATTPDPVVLARSGEVATLTLTNTRRTNAMSRDACRQLRDGLA